VRGSSTSQGSFFTPSGPEWGSEGLFSSFFWSFERESPVSQYRDFRFGWVFSGKWASG
jgi:hypothetical protein